MENLHAPGSKHKSQPAQPPPAFQALWLIPDISKAGIFAGFCLSAAVRFVPGSSAVALCEGQSRGLAHPPGFYPCWGSALCNGKVRAAGTRQEICHIYGAIKKQRVIQICSSLQFFGADPLTSRAVGLTPAGNSPQPFPELTPAM